MNNKIKNIKLAILQNKYKILSDVILKFEKHIDNLHNSYYIDFVTKTQILNEVFNIAKSMNNSYNNYIVSDLETTSTTDFDNILLNFCDLFNNDFICDNVLNILKPYNHLLPLNDLEHNINELIMKYGYENLKETINILEKENFKHSKDINDFIDEINKCFIPTKVEYYDVSNKTDMYYWRIKQDFDENDHLELTRELWIKNTLKEKEYYKIEGYFIPDTLSSFIKNSQINYQYLQKQKLLILAKIQQSTINAKFAKKFVRHDYLGNIYTMNINEYINHIDNYYQMFLEVTNSSFVNIMKDYILKGSELKKMFDIIFLLLLGNSDSIDIAGLLLGLTKEKKTNSPNIFNVINQRLPYFLILKIKKSNNNIKNEIEKLKSLTTDDVDLKKQLVINKNIPSSVKSLVLEKIEEMKSFNNEYYKQQTFVKHILNYPWPSNNDDIIFEEIKNNPNRARKYLNDIDSKLKSLSYGHDEAKKVLLQTIGKWISNPSSQGTCFGLVGPPGVGKTLLAKSVSKALDIPFAEITLGGQNDGEILHGHGYTYSGSQPGLIIKKMVEMGKSRCILYFDELDKACSKHGSVNEITSILIHLTDPNMNKTFQDRFFQGVDFPLNKVIMIFSYNDANLVDPILLDRLKQINVSAYTVSEKIKIVKEFIIPEVAESIGLSIEKWTDINDDLIEFIIENYTNEAGVRSIKRKIEQIFLTLNIEKIYNNGNFKDNNFKEITKEIIIKILDKPNNDNTKIYPKSEVGIINGLYATSAGDGGIIPIQVFNNFMPSDNSFEIKLTGKQGDVMKESVHCSLTAAIGYIAKNVSKYSIKDLDEYLSKNFKYGFHVHAPSTSTPKDGPSAGCAFTSAFISRILNKTIKNDVAMTGEIELTGKITKIGGLNFKLIGAKKAGVKMVYVPLENKDDLNEIKGKYPNLINNDFRVELFEYIDEIIDKILN